MKYIAVIDADEKPVSCEFIGCNGNVAPYLIGATTNIKPLEQEPILNKIRAEIERHRRKTESIDTYDLVGDCLDIVDRYMTESEG